MSSRFAKAFVEGIHRFKTDKRLALATIEKYTKTKTTAASEQVYEIYANRYVKRTPEITPEGMQTVLEGDSGKPAASCGDRAAALCRLTRFPRTSRERFCGRALSQPLTRTARARSRDPDPMAARAARRPRFCVTREARENSCLPSTVACP